MLKVTKSLTHLFIIGIIFQEPHTPLFSFKSPFPNQKIKNLISHQIPYAPLSYDIIFQEPHTPLFSFKSPFPNKKIKNLISHAFSLMLFIQPFIFNFFFPL
jgi:hypothetical protein